MKNKVDLQVFQDLNEEQGKVVWERRYEIVKDTFPDTVLMDWHTVFEDDPKILGTIINDIIKASTASPKRPGKRGAVDKQVALDQLRQLTGDDYTIERFAIALRTLKGDLSIRALAAKVGLHRSQIEKLLAGDIEPDLKALVRVAEAYGKRPDYFLEYRIRWILALLVRRLEVSPESSIVTYRKLNNIGGSG